MRNKVKVKVLGNYVHVGKELDYKRVVLDFEEYMNDTSAMEELRNMPAKVVVNIVREVWEEIKLEN